MVQIKNNLFIGDITDCGSEGMNIIHACKEPCHRKFMGYQIGKACPKGPGYYYALTEHDLYLNLVDSPNPRFISDQVVQPTMAIIHKSLKKIRPVLIHCNKGESRAPGLGLIYLIFCGELNGNYDQVVTKFKEIYPNFNPSKGMAGYIKSLLEGGEVNE